jgi:general secretion pathway protein M
MSAIPLPDPRPARDRQIAVAILAGAVILVVAIIALPMWLAHRHYDVALADATNRLDRYGRIFATRPSVVKQLEAIRGKETRRYFLRSGGASLSAAEAQEAVRGLIESSGGRLITMQAPVAKEEGRYRLITANVQLQANIFALRKILAAIETNVPFLFVDNLTVRSQVPGNFRPQPGQEPEMFVQFDVSGYALTGTP